MSDRLRAMFEHNTRPPYRWVIDKDHFGEGPKGTNLNAKGKEGPFGLDWSIDENMSRFSKWTDDQECVYEGRIFGDYDGFEPLDDYGTPNFGCTAIKLDGEWV